MQKKVPKVPSYFPGVLTKVPYTTEIVGSIPDRAENLFFGGEFLLVFTMTEVGPKIFFYDRKARNCFS